MIPERYNWDGLKRAVRHPKKLKKEICYLLSRPRNTVNRYRYGPGTDIMDKDWDNLVILDACRYDGFEQQNTIDGRLQPCVSKGGTSKEFIERNFKNTRFHDTVYITANPFVGLVDPDTFHAVVSLLDRWDTEHQTVLPGTVVDTVESVSDEYPNKRLIVDFMQPHQPYLGERADIIRARIEEHTDAIGWNNEERTASDQSVSRPEGIRHYEAATNPEIDVDRDDVWEAYTETLEIALDHVKRMLQSIKGKTVLTADHGELLGERPYICSTAKYGHFYGEWMEELRIVPWFVVESDQRRHIRPEPPAQHDVVDEEQLDEKLEMLGYK